MIKRISAIIFGLIAFLTLPIIAFADGTFTASNYSFDPSTGILSFTASNFSPARSSDTGAINDFSISNYNSSGQFVLDYYNYSLDPGATLLPNLTTDFNSLVTYNSYWNATLPTNSDPVYLRISQGSSGSYVSQSIPANQLISLSSTPTPTPTPSSNYTFTASNYSFDTSTHTLKFTASNFNPPRSTDTGAINDFSISNYNSSGQFVLDYYNYSLDPGATLLPNLTTDFNSLVTYNSYWNATLPTNSDPVYLRISQGSSGSYVSQSIPANQLISSQNQAPTINPLSNVTVNEGDTYSTTGSFTDPDSTSWTATVDYGDGGGAQSLTLNADKTFNLSHVYQDEGTYTVTVKVTDNQGATGTGTATVTVNNATPTVGAITVSNPVVQVNNSITASANFTDAGVLDTHNNSGTYWNWGDGNSSTATVTESNGSGSVSDSHTYTAAGVYTVTLTITDDDGTHPGSQTYQYVSVYNPTSQGLFSAGQHFTSPAGADPANPNATGNVQFGLAYKYQGTMPTSDRQFTMNFKSDNLLFNATTVSSLVVANSFATLTGTGTINGGSNTYNFLVTGVNGGDIRIQITDPANNNNAIYDTQPNAAATATPTTSVTGNVVVHN